jgi:hypothetical protein
MDGGGVGGAGGQTAVGGGGGTTGSTGLAGQLGLSDDQLLQLQRALQSAGNSFLGPSGGGALGQAGFMRAGPAPPLAQGQPNNLITTIMQMRANQAAAMGQPYQAGLAAPATSLLR